jgi:putative sigma-54 modulation protein
MDVEYTGRQVTISKKLKQQVEAGLARIVKVVGDSGSAHVVFTTEKYRQIAEITVQLRNRKLVAVCEATSMELALRDSLAKVENQAIKHTKRRTTIKRHRNADSVGVAGGTGEKSAALAAAPPKVAVKSASKNGAGRKTVPMLVHTFPSHSPLQEPHVVRSRDGAALRPMSLEEAVKEAAFRDRDVFVFRDHGGQAMVLYRKRDGKIELIEVP